MIKQHTTTCDIYKREIEDLISSGDERALSQMIKTWYTRCDFKKAPNGSEILAVGMRDDKIIWFETSRGTVEFCSERDRWRLIEHGSEPIYMMARIAEVTQVPFAYLCGVRDAICAIESKGMADISNRLKLLRKEDRLLSQQLRRKQIAADTAVVGVESNLPVGGVSQSRYPDAPHAALTWTQVRKHYRCSPGVYFAWSDGRVVYVGATERGMHSRLGNGHHAVTRQDMFSFVELPANEVYFAEACYIARYAPERNACVAQANGFRKGGNRGKRKERAAAETASTV